MNWWAFDLDGTILNCRKRQVAVMKMLVQSSLRLPFDEDAYWTTKRDGLDNKQALLAAGVPKPAIYELCDSWLEVIEDDEWLILDEPLDGSREALAAAQESGIRSLLLTARRRPVGVYETLQRFDLSSFIDDVRIVPPDSKVDEKKAEHLLQYEVETFFGDSESDYNAAKRAGVAFSAIDCGQRSSEFLIRSGVTMTYPTLREAVEDVLRTNG